MSKEETAEKYEKLNIQLIQIEAHHKIEEVRQQPDKEFATSKKYLPETAISYIV